LAAPRVLRMYAPYATNLCFILSFTVVPSGRSGWPSQLNELRAIAWRPSWETEAIKQRPGLRVRQSASGSSLGLCYSRHASLPERRLERAIALVSVAAATRTLAFLWGCFRRIPSIRRWLFPRSPSHPSETNLSSRNSGIFERIPSEGPGNFGCVPEGRASLISSQQPSHLATTPFVLACCSRNTPLHIPLGRGPRPGRWHADGDIQRCSEAPAP